MIGVGFLGYGYWGPNLVRNFSNLTDVRVSAICDPNTARRELATKQHPGAKVCADLKEVLADSSVDVLVIATPVTTHFELTLEALRNGKHVFVEKPLASSSEECEVLIAEAEARNLVLHVDHTFVYTGAVQTIADIIRTGQLGELYYYDSVRVNLGLFQPDVSVIWDLAVHDLSIIDHLFGLRGCAVSATGIKHVREQPVNVAFMTLFLQGNAVAHMHVNWLAPVKVRRTLVGGSQRMIVYDDLEPSEKVKIYDKGISINGNANKDDLYRNLIEYRTGDMRAPKISVGEALQTEAEHFIKCVNNGKQSLTDGKAGLRVVRVLEAATKSMQQRGEPVEVCAQL